MSEANTIGTSMFTVDCPHANRCSDKGIKCGSCAHNKKRSFYEPATPYPWYTTYPGTPTPIPPMNPVWCFGGGWR